MHAAFHGCILPGHAPLANNAALELSKCAQHTKHHATGTVDYREQN